MVEPFVICHHLDASRGFFKGLSSEAGIEQCSWTKIVWNNYNGAYHGTTCYNNHELMNIYQQINNDQHRDSFGKSILSGFPHIFTMLRIDFPCLSLSQLHSTSWEAMEQKKVDRLQILLLAIFGSWWYRYHGIRSTKFRSKLWNKNWRKRKSRVLVY